MNLKRLQTVFLILVLFSSCTAYKNVPYFQDLKADSILSEKITNNVPLTIQPGDLLGLHVTSLSHEADAVFNYNLERPNSASNTVGSGDISRTEQNSIIGYLVDYDGNIHLPTIGPLKVSGYTTAQISKMVEEKLSQVLSQPTVAIRIQNFKVSVLGDVKTPGSYGLMDERATVNEVLAMAGDLNTTGLRKNIMLIREVDGKRQYIPLDITSKKFISSPYYYLKNNDIIYVQPNRERVLASDSYFQKLSLLLSALTIVVVYLSR